MIGACYHSLGDFAMVQEYCESAQMPQWALLGQPGLSFGFDYRIPAACAYARILWLQGNSQQAERIAAQIIAQVEQEGDPVSLCFCFSWLTPIVLWSGNWAAAEGMIKRSAAVADEYSLGPYSAVSQAFAAVISVGQGHTETGITALRRGIEAVKAKQFSILTVVLSIALAEILVTAGKCDAALEVADEILDLAESAGELYSAELSQIKARALASRARPKLPEAETLLRQAVAGAQRRRALVWELRAAMSLARLYLRLGRAEEAYPLVEGVYGRFTEGFGAPDLQAAERLMGAQARVLAARPSP
jgi:ATP/maltotriose-dependent transcriptional regulator MalT